MNYRVLLLLIMSIAHGSSHIKAMNARSNAISAPVLSLKYVSACVASAAALTVLYNVGLIAQYAYNAYASMHANDLSVQSMNEEQRAVTQELDRMFSDEYAQEIIQKYNTEMQKFCGALDRSVHPATHILSQLGFVKLSSAFVFPDNPLLHKYLFKMPTNDRLQTARIIESIICTLKLQHVRLAHKYAYQFPHSNITMIVVQKIEEQERPFSHEELDELLKVMIILDYLKVPFTDLKKKNFITTNDKVYIIDTESWSDRTFLRKKWRVNFWKQSESNALIFVKKYMPQMDQQSLQAFSQIVIDEYNILHCSALSKGLI